MQTLPARTIQVLCDSAVDAAAASIGWLAVVDGTDLVIAAASGTDPNRALALVGQRAPIGTGTSGFVLQSGQPVALRPGGASGSDGYTTAVLGADPTSVVCVPCALSGDAVGVLQVIDKANGNAFDFDDIEIVSVLGTIAGAVIADAGSGVSEVAPPARLSADLTSLADADPDRYAAVATVVASLLRLS